MVSVEWVRCLCPALIVATTQAFVIHLSAGLVDISLLEQEGMYSIENHISVAAYPKPFQTFSSSYFIVFMLFDQKAGDFAVV